jgi:8-oxo-dGTP pyrophosphatase MutT (NUDIX family)
MSGPDGVPGSGPPAGAAGPPGWLTALAHSVARDGLAFRPDDWPETPPDARPAAVLILFGPGERGTELLLLERSADLRKHAGQPAFPGGGAEPGDASPHATALREAQEEVGLDPAGVDVLSAAPAIYLPYSNFLVTPVLAWWRAPSPVFAVDRGETSAVARVPVADLVDPANRVRLSHPRTLQPTPGFRVDGLAATVWGFTAGILDALLRISGLEVPWGDGPPVEDATVLASIAASPTPSVPAPLDEADAGEIEPDEAPGLDAPTPGVATGALPTEEGSAA